MNLHEYQAKGLFAEYGLPVSEGYAVDTAEEAVEAAKKIGGDPRVRPRALKTPLAAPRAAARRAPPSRLLSC